MKAEKVRKLLEEGYHCIDHERVCSIEEHDGLKKEYEEALKELEGLEND
jgi:hypothetical protein